jgi:hypothetical protein
LELNEAARVDRAEKSELPRADCDGDERNWLEGGRFESNEAAGDAERPALDGAKRLLLPAKLLPRAEFQEVDGARLPPEKLEEKPRAFAGLRPQELRVEKESREPELNERPMPALDCDRPKPCEKRPPPEFAKEREENADEFDPREPIQLLPPRDPPENAPREALMLLREDPPLKREPPPA